MQRYFLYQFKAISVEKVGRNVRVLLGDETAIVKAFLPVNENIRTGSILLLQGAEAIVDRGHIEIQMPRNGKINKT